LNRYLLAKFRPLPLSPLCRRQARLGLEVHRDSRPLRRKTASADRYGCDRRAHARPSRANFVRERQPSSVHTVNGKLTKVNNQHTILE
jgi:hypothetical protein